MSVHLSYQYRQFVLHCLNFQEWFLRKFQKYLYTIPSILAILALLALQPLLLLYHLLVPGLIINFLFCFTQLLISLITFPILLNLFLIIPVQVLPN